MGKKLYERAAIVVERQVVFDQNLTLRAFRVYCAMMLHSPDVKDVAARFSIGLRQLGREMGISHLTVHRSIHLLKQVGYLVQEHQGRGRRAKYRLATPDTIDQAMLRAANKVGLQRVTE
jgi:biotin operon repressor